MKYIAWPIGKESDDAQAVCSCVTSSDAVKLMMNMTCDLCVRHVMLNSVPLLQMMAPHHSCV